MYAVDTTYMSDLVTVAYRILKFGWKNFAAELGYIATPSKLSLPAIFVAYIQPLG